MNCSVKRLCSLCLFLGHFDCGFAGASELSEPGSFLWANWSLSSELSEVEVLSPPLSSGCWSGACLSFFLSFRA